MLLEWGRIKINFSHKRVGYSNKKGSLRVGLVKLLTAMAETMFAVNKLTSGKFEMEEY